MDVGLLLQFQQYLINTKAGTVDKEQLENEYSDLSIASIYTKYADEFEEFAKDYFGEDVFEKMDSPRDLLSNPDLLNGISQETLDAYDEEIAIAMGNGDVNKASNVQETGQVAQVQPVLPNVEQNKTEESAQTPNKKGKCNVSSVNNLEDINLSETDTNVLNKLFGLDDENKNTQENQSKADELLSSLIDDNKGVTKDKVKILQDYISKLTDKKLSEDDIVKTIKMLDGKEDELSADDFKELARLVKDGKLDDFLNEAGIQSNEAAANAAEDPAAAGAADAGSTGGGGPNAPASAQASLDNMSVEDLEAELAKAKTDLDEALKSVNSELVERQTTAENNLKAAQDESARLDEQIGGNKLLIVGYQATIDANNTSISDLNSQLSTLETSEGVDGLEGVEAGSEMAEVAEEAADAQKETIESQKQSISEQIAKLEEENKKLEEQIKELEAENAELEAKKLEQDALVTQYTEELASIEQEISTIASTNETVGQAQQYLNDVQSMYDKRVSEKEAADKVEILDVNTNAKDLRNSEDMSNLPLTYELDGKTYHCPKFASYDTDGDGVKDFEINSWEEFQRYALNAGICNVGKYGSMQCQNASAWYMQFALGVADMSIIKEMKAESENSSYGNNDTAGMMTTQIGEEAGKNQRYLTKVKGNRDESYELIVNELKNGRPCVVSVPGGSSAHYVLAMGISDDGDILIMDSYNCAMKKLGYANSAAYAKGDKQHRNLASGNGVLVFSQGHTYLYGDNGDWLKNEQYWETCGSDVDYRNWLAICNSPNARKLLSEGGRFEELGAKFGVP